MRQSPRKACPWRLVGRQPITGAISAIPRAISDFRVGRENAMCGIIGIAGKSPVNQALYDGLTVLQHRGQDAAGLMTCDPGRSYLREDTGLVRHVSHTRHMRRLLGNMGIGHVRYPTAGSSSSAESQPFYVNSPFGISLVHNGNLINAAQLERDVFVQDLRHINTESDSEVLLN